VSRDAGSRYDFRTADLPNRPPRVLFNSTEYIFYFLPITLGVFIACHAAGWVRTGFAWLSAASLFYYSWWNPVYLPLIVLLIVLNYALGVAIGRNRERPLGKAMLVFGLAMNLGLLAYYKYANFIVDNVGALTGSSWHLDEIVLPLAISFFTFQKIAFLVDTYRGIAREYRFVHFCLFVTFFPQLIAGPIVHHKEMIPQFERRVSLDRHLYHFAFGVLLFAIGLFKKVVLADGIAVHATPVFDAAEARQQLDLFTAWGGALAYTFQLYFDFSGYSDMAIGAARMFGIRLPLNFDSPYRSVSIIDFWRRWHMTLSRFLRDYLYIPLGGNRKGRARRALNLWVTMLLGGLWHGAGWTFVAWGALHGAYLTVNHAWRASGGRHWRIPLPIAWGLTMLAVIVGWVFFRAHTFGGAWHLLGAMAGLQGTGWADLRPALQAAVAQLGGLGWREHVLWLTAVDVPDLPGHGPFGSVLGFLLLPVLLAVVVLMPASHHVVARTLRLAGRRTPAAVTQVLLRCVVLVFGCFLALAMLNRVSEFLYFQF
jgi:D-alanyl-lipoteichoic acid acyltransferase DltB (MBOAT superfamily)